MRTFPEALRVRRRDRPEYLVGEGGLARAGSSNRAPSSTTCAISSATPTSSRRRYLRSTTQRLERALTLLEEHEQRRARAKNARRGKKGSRKVPLGATRTESALVAGVQPDAETIDLIEDFVVSGKESNSNAQAKPGEPDYSAESN